MIKFHKYSYLLVIGVSLLLSLSGCIGINKSTPKYPKNTKNAEQLAQIKLDEEKEIERLNEQRKQREIARKKEFLRQKEIEKNQAIDSFYHQPTSVKELIKSITDLQNMKQGEFEKKYDFEKRKLEAIKNTSLDGLYSTELPSPIDMRYNPDKEVWEIKLADLTRGVSYAYKKMKKNDHFLIKTDEIYKRKREYIATNRMGAQVTVTEYSSKYFGLYIQHEEMMKSLSRHIKGSGQYTTKLVLEMPIPLNEAKKYNNMAMLLFGCRLVYRIDGNVNDKDIIGDGTQLIEATYDSPTEIFSIETYLRIRPVGLVVYKRSTKPTILSYLDF